MVDVLSTRLQDIYSRWDGNGPRQLGRMDDINSHKARYNASRSQNPGIFRQDEELFSLKEKKWNPINDSNNRPFMGLSCLSCTPSSRNTWLDDKAQRASLLNVLNLESIISIDGILPRIFPGLTRAFYYRSNYSYPYIFESVLNDERLQEVVKESTKQTMEEADISTGDADKFSIIHKSQKEKAVKILKGLRSTISSFMISLGAWLFNKVMLRLFTSVVVHPAHIDMLKKASTTGLPLIFIPLHRSHFDYIIITYILTVNNINSPLVAAGENLKIPVFGWILRRLGAFFIKRKIDPVQGRKNILYRGILHTYMIECLRAGYNFEFFIEGGRTRSGKPSLPKGGLLSVFIDAYIDGTIEDALLVPVSINYDKLVDGNFVCEQLGQPKQMENFGSAVKAIWKVFTDHYGIMRVDFNQPFSLKELVRSFQTKLEIENKYQSSKPKGKVLHSLPSSASLYGTDVVTKEQRLLVDHVARHIVYDCCRSTAVMSTNAISFLLLNAFRNGINMDTLSSALDSLRSVLDERGRDLGFSGESVDVINHAITLLGPALIKKERDADSGCTLIKPITLLPNVIELSYYSNSVLSHFALDSILAISINSLIKDSRSSCLDNDLLIEQCSLLCDIFQFEFIFTKSCQSLESAIYDTINNFKEKEIMKQKQNVLLDQKWRNMAEHLRIDDYEENQQNQQISYSINLDNEKLKLYDVLLRPFLDVYITSAANLANLISETIPERTYVATVLKDLTESFERGTISYGESVSVDTIRNTLKLFERWNVLECHTKDKVKVYYLSQNYDNESSVETILKKISKFR